MSNYITNLCPNPGFEASLSGWAALTGTTLSQDATYVAYGQQAMKVVTDGAAPSEGFYGPAVDVTATTTCSASLYLYSATGGIVTLSAVSGTTGQVLASAVVQLTDSWQRAQVSGFTVQGGTSFAIWVQTTSPQALTFWADAAQMETGVTNASPYIDGDQPGCFWEGIPELSASVQPYQHSASANGSMLLDGHASPAQYGKSFTTSASGLMTMTGDAAPEAAVPAAAFDDFAIFELTDPDPAMTYVGQNNAGTNSGHTTWALNYGLFFPPRDYPVSGGKYAWRRAAYMAMGLKFSQVAAGQEQNISQAQVALSPMTGSSPVPAAYTPPRQIQTIIKPTRLNFCTNPSFEAGTAGWNGVGTGAVAQDATTVPQPAYQTIAQAGALAAFANSTAISNDGTSGTASFDGAGHSYSAQAMAAAGLSPGAEVTIGGISYTIPSAGAGQPDNLIAAGQVIPLPCPAGASVIGFLGAGQGGTGSTSGTLTVTYTDGTSTTATLGFTDWDSTTVYFGNQVSAEMPYRNNRDGSQDPTTVYLYTATVAINPAKAVASITLPAQSQMHIFAASVAEPAGTLTGNYSGKVTIKASGDGISISVPDLIIGDTYIVSMYAQAGAGLADIIAQCSGGSATLGEATGGTGYGSGGYGEGPYGGVGPGTSDLSTGVWQRISFTFTAGSSTETLTVTALPGTDVIYPANFWIDGVLIEAGTELLPYFDGSFGSSAYLDYQWEGAAALSRSYYYENFAAKKYTIGQILAKHTPIGVTHASPVYLQPYTQ